MREDILRNDLTLDKARDLYTCPAVRMLTTGRTVTTRKIARHG
jgi:hypothetical protein